MALRRLVAFASLAMAFAGDLALASTSSAPPSFLSPAAHFKSSAANLPIVLTLDACGGSFDWELARHLSATSTPATIFATGSFIRRNPDAVEFLRARPDLFDIQNHGGRHVAAIGSKSGSVWGVRLAGSVEAVEAEIRDVAASIRSAFGSEASVYRGAAALYDKPAMEAISRLGYEVGGFAISLDDGGSLGSKQVLARMLSAKPGDVVLGHIGRVHV